jgi:Fe-S cluster assembly protein SufD
VRAATDTVVSPYVAEYERFDEARAGNEPDWLRAERQKALARFISLGFPTTKQEEWRFTNVSPIAERPFRVSADGGEGLRKEHIAAFRFAASGAAEIVFVNGRFAPHLSSPHQVAPGVTVRSLAETLATDPDRLSPYLTQYAAFENRPFAALNTAFVADGAFIDIARDAVLEGPLHVLFITAPTGDEEGGLSLPRVLVLARRNSQARLVESYASVEGSAESRVGDAQGTTGAVSRPLRPSGQPRFTNAVTEILLEDGAVLDHYRVQREAPTAYHVSATNVRLSHGSTFSSHAFTFGGGLVRNEINAHLAGEGGDCTLNGLYVADGSRLVDNQTFIDHARPHCGSREVYKGVLAGHARAVFNGKILVRPDAQKTDAKQTNKTLLLSNDAQINTKPQLEIYANDVKCTHGATVGQLDADALFYLRARGIDKRDAEQMLVRAFAADITGRVRIEPLREMLEALLESRV